MPPEEREDREREHDRGCQDAAGERIGGPFESAYLADQVLDAVGDDGGLEGLKMVDAAGEHTAPVGDAVPWRVAQESHRR